MEGVQCLGMEAGPGSWAVGLGQFGSAVRSHGLLYPPLQGKRYGEGMVQKVVEQ